MTREERLEAKRRKQAAALQVKLDQERHQRVRECLQWWADNTREKRYGD